MLWHMRPSQIENEKRQATNLRGCSPQVESLPALSPRLVGPEASAA